MSIFDTRWGVQHKWSVARFPTLERAKSDQRWWEEEFDRAFPVVYRRWYQKKWRIYT